MSRKEAQTILDALQKVIGNLELGLVAVNDHGPTIKLVDGEGRHLFDLLAITGTRVVYTYGKDVTI